LSKEKGESHHKKTDRRQRKTCLQAIRCIIINLTQAKEHKKGDYLWSGRNEGRIWRRKSIYNTPQVLAVLHRIWKAADFNYANEWALLQNHIYPSVKLLSKIINGAKYIKIHDKPTTPYQRVIAADKITRNNKKLLIALHNALNPFILKKSIETKLKAIFEQISVSSNLKRRV
jgi:hypothetical protein